MAWAADVKQLARMLDCVWRDRSVKDDTGARTALSCMRMRARENAHRNEEAVHHKRKCKSKNARANANAHLGGVRKRKSNNAMANANAHLGGVRCVARSEGHVVEIVAEHALPRDVIEDDRRRRHVDKPVWSHRRRIGIVVCLDDGGGGGGGVCMCVCVCVCVCARARVCVW
jgi:hypothetical protein